MNVCIAMKKAAYILTDRSNVGQALVTDRQKTNLYGNGLSSMWLLDQRADISLLLLLELQTFSL
jgi:hypothetical protein